MRSIPRAVTLVLALSLAAGAFAAKRPEGAQEPPRLVVLLVVDQMRDDLLDRYADRYTGGFRRFLDRGFRVTVASHAHAHTETAAGHATISTGVFPSRSGIVANDWDERTGDTWAPMYALGDSTSPIVGAPEMEGRSPNNLLRSGLADWILAADPASRAAAISGKDRAAITLAGLSRAETYWLTPALDRFVTSTYYRSDYPEWVTRFNEGRMKKILADSVSARAVNEEQGRLSFSATDYVGHAFGPESEEQLENLVHLDRELGELFAFLDREVGEGRWVAGLSADHGVMTMPERLARLVERRGLVAKAYTHRQLTLGEYPDTFAVLFRNSYYPGRAAGPLSHLGVEVRFGHHTLVSRGTGTTHGSAYGYDRFVPFLLLGPGVRPGASTTAVRTVDLAPTLARLAGVPTPADLDGRSVYR